MTEAPPNAETGLPRRRPRFQISLSAMLLMMVVFAMISATLFYASKVPALRQEISVLLTGEAGESTEDVDRVAQRAFIMFTFTSPLPRRLRALNHVGGNEVLSSARIRMATSDQLSEIREALGPLADLNEGLEPFAESLFRRHHSALRLRHGLTIEPQPFVGPPIEWYPLGFRVNEVDSTARPSRSVAYGSGDFFLQDAGSMLALAACQADVASAEARMICDLCAAPGGKASALLESIGSGFLLANEPIQSRVAPLAYNLARTGVPRYAITSLDPAALANQLAGVFDLVLVDAPCSGQALLGKGKQSESALSPKQIEYNASRARRILSAAVRLLRPGGQLVFSTCTFAELENEAQIRWLISESSVLADPVARLAAYRSDQTGTCYRLWPHRHDCAGSFAGSVRVQADPAGARRFKPTKPEKSIQELAQWYDSVPRRLQTKGASTIGWPDDAPPWVESVALTGPEIAYRTGRTWKPAHAGALRTEGAAIASQHIELNEADAVRYLRGMPIPCSPRGWLVACHNQRPLGWLKASAGTGKNHLPGSARWPA